MGLIGINDILNSLSYSFKGSDVLFPDFVTYTKDEILNIQNQDVFDNVIRIILKGFINAELTLFETEKDIDGSESRSKEFNLGAYISILPLIKENPYKIYTAKDFVGMFLNITKTESLKVIEWPLEHDVNIQDCHILAEHIRSNYDLKRTMDLFLLENGCSVKNLSTLLSLSRKLKEDFLERAASLYKKCFINKTEWEALKKANKDYINQAVAEYNETIEEESKKNKVEEQEREKRETIELNKRKEILEKELCEEIAHMKEKYDLKISILSYISRIANDTEFIVEPRIDFPTDAYKTCANYYKKIDAQGKEKGWSKNDFRGKIIRQLENEHIMDTICPKTWKCRNKKTSMCHLRLAPFIPELDKRVFEIIESIKYKE